MNTPYFHSLLCKFVPVLADTQITYEQLSMNQVTDEFKSFAKTWQKQGLPLDGDYLDSVMKEIQKDGEEVCVHGHLWIAVHT